MELQKQVLAELENNRGQAISGTKLAQKLFVTRSAIWKVIKALRSDGHDITAVTNKGYCLSDNNDILSEQSIVPHLVGDATRLKIEVHKSVTSTNSVLKEYAQAGAESGTVIISSQQTAGKGRLGRVFHSPKDTGVYFSILMRPQLDIPQSILITTSVAVAVAEAIDELSGRNTSIKWVNDIFIDERKVCGILTEASVNFESGRLEYAIVGIGINVFPSELPEELEGIAGSVFLQDDVNSPIRSKLVATILNKISVCMNELSEKKYIDKYREKSFLIGKEVTLINSKSSVNAIVLGIDDEAHLIVKYDDGRVEALSSGEVSVRPKYN